MQSTQSAPILIDDPMRLRQLAAWLGQQPTVAVDTESNSLFAYQEQVCLIQFTAEGLDYLVDPLILADLSPLGQLFANPRVKKIFHAAEYDLICLKRDYDFTFTNLFDTMHASRILGRTILGLGAILEQEFGVHPDKRLQRANWARRPLTPEMLDYARMDTHFLQELYVRLSVDLEAEGLSELAEEDFRRFTRVAPGAYTNGDHACWRISGSQDLTPRQAAVLVELCAFREERARAMNVPPFRVVSNQVLLEVARAMPRKTGDLAQIAELSPKLVDRLGAALLEAVERGIVGPPAYRPHAPRLSDDILWRLDSLREWRKLTARELGVESDIVLPRDVMEAIADRNPANMAELQDIMHDLPWRIQRFGTQILNVLAR